MKFTDLVPAIAIEQTMHEREVAITGLAYSSRKVQPGHVFVCIRGVKADGHTFAPAAVNAGAVALVVEEFIKELDVPQYRVRDARSSLAALADAFYGHPTQKMKTIGITATNGKTSTSFMANAILEEQGLQTGLIGTVVVKIGQKAEPSELTTPESLDLQRYFSEMVEQSIKHAVMEVSSSALELDRVGSVDFDIVTFNNISREHIDLHSSFENYVMHKSKLVTRAGADKVAILNLDDAYSAALQNQTEAHVITIGVESEEADIRCTDLDLSTGRANFTVSIARTIETPQGTIPQGEFQVSLGTPGYHSVYNSLVAIAIGLLCEASVEIIQKAMHDFTGVERRFEMIFEESFKVIDDHFANSGNIDITLGTVEKMDYQNLKLIYAIRGDRGVTVNRENAEAIVRWAPKLGLTEVIATVSKSHVTAKDVVAEEEKAVFLEVMEAAGITVHLYEELPEAVQQGLAQANDKDVVLLAGCQGMDYGAKYALEQLAEMNPGLDREKLFKPLATRVAGV
ncbi:UDP-N-acetylmuramyl-tripeptide synthetase [Chryseomicrobium sp. FSL W7-1435]|uniref:Mur ligase family protein n=1 Tax=Chryseomicrobium sp. FSL W7-1435 TaxID=2921704 RepID=UPI003159D577